MARSLIPWFNPNQAHRRVRRQWERNDDGMAEKWQTCEFLSGKPATTARSITQLWRKPRMSDVLASYEIGRLQNKATDLEAHRETNAGFRGGKDKGLDGSKAGSSKTSGKAPEKMVKVGTIQVLVSGVDSSGKPRKAMSNGQGGILEDAILSSDWTGTLDDRIRGYTVVQGFLTIWMLITVFPRVNDCPYVVVAKNNRKIFVKRSPINGELLDTVKGSSGHRKSLFASCPDDPLAVSRSSPLMGRG
ncbi:hypothetical protein B0H13DRAFT_1886595 [Mycena leptocephala]|nr:hypothetical protein B0H13DRAFT_1886595 [Mycena leptocephala]